MKALKKYWKPAVCTLVALGVLCLAVVFGLDALVRLSVQDRILQADQVPQADCILVLGCGVWDNEQPSHMLEDRLRRSMELYELGAAPKLLMSGDHGREGYNEVKVMKHYAVNAGADSQAVFMDHAGFSTYESLYRAKEIFGAEKIIIVSQEYHLYRALYIAQSLGMEAYGVAADYRNYSGQSAREVREVLARCKDVLTSITLPNPTYLGPAIPLSGSGDATNDEAFYQ